MAAGHEIAIVVTQRDRRRGRGSGEVPTPVKATALELGIPVSHRIRDVVDAQSELGVVVAFGRIIPKDVLDILPMVNLHFSLLPRWRGAAPVERAILAGDEFTGVSLMALDEGLDTGPIYTTIKVAIAPDERADALTLRLGEIGSGALIERLQSGTSGLGTPTVQVGEATYAQKLASSEFRLDFSSSAEHCARVVLLGRAFSLFRGKRLLVHRAHVASSEEILQLASSPALTSTPGTLLAPFVICGQGALALDEVQLEGRARQQFADFANGVRLADAEVLEISKGAAAS